MTRGASGGASLLSLVTALCLAAPAGATEEPSAEQAARAAFDAGRELASQGSYDAACRKFEESIAFVDAIGTTYNLADCEERRGHLARAQKLFSSVARRAHELDQREREQVARDRASALDERLSLISIEATAPGVTLSLDGQPLSADAAKEAIAIEPGTHRLSARAEGKKPWSKQLDIPRARLLVPVKVPPLEALAAPQRPAPAPRGSALPHRAKSQRAHGSSTLAWVVGGVGVGATVTGAFFGWRYLSNNSDAKSICPAGANCRAEQIAQHKELVDRARTARNLSYVGLGVGAAALVGATVLSLSVGEQKQMSATVSTSDGSLSATLQGKF